MFLRILIFWLVAGSSFACSGAAAVGPVWLVSNGLHTSIAMWTRDLPRAEQLHLDPRAGILVVGWGATTFYKGSTNSAILLRSAFPGPSTLHVVPVRGALTRRFPHSDVVRFSLPAEARSRLGAEVMHAFAIDGCGRPIPAGRGYFPESRFYKGRETFYFPYMCNLWTALRLRRSGVPLFLPECILAPALMAEARRYGQTEQRLSEPTDGF